MTPRRSPQGPGQPDMSARMVQKLQLPSVPSSRSQAAMQSTKPDDRTSDLLSGFLHGLIASVVTALVVFCAALLYRLLQ